MVERARQVAFWRTNDWTYRGIEMVTSTYFEAGDIINKLAGEGRIFVDALNNNSQAGGGTFLPCMAKCRLHEIFYRCIDICTCGDNECILTTGFSEQIQIITPLHEHIGGIKCTGEDERFDIWMCN